jgi:hypothetical protein
MHGNGSDGMRAIRGFWVLLAGNVRMNESKTTIRDSVGSRRELNRGVHFDVLLY